MSELLIVWLSTNRVATWLIKHVASRLDPLIFRATNGRLTSFGPPAMPMLTITATGRRTGRPRSVHLAGIKHEGDCLVVASAMGQEKHPAWPAPICNGETVQTHAHLMARGVFGPAA